MLPWAKVLVLRWRWSCQACQWNCQCIFLSVHHHVTYRIRCNDALLHNCKIHVRLCCALDFTYTAGPPLSPTHPLLSFVLIQSSPSARLDQKISTAVCTENKMKTDLNSISFLNVLFKLWICSIRLKKWFLFLPHPHFYSRAQTFSPSTLFTCPHICSAPWVL